MKYYINAASGDDINGNGSFTQPYKTLNALYAKGAMASPDMTVMLAEGDYTIPPALITNMVDNCNLTLHGTGINTNINILADYRNWNGIGTNTTTLTFEKLTLNATNMAHYFYTNGQGLLYDYNFWDLKCILIIKNVLFKNFKYSSGCRTYGGHRDDIINNKYFFRQTYNDITVINCSSYFTNYTLSGIWSDIKYSFTFTTNPYMFNKGNHKVTVINSYGNLGSNSATWDINTNNFITSGVSTSYFDDKYKILDITANALKVGIYYGAYPWLFSDYIIFMDGNYYSIQDKYYDTTNKMYNPIPLSTIEENGFNQYSSSDLSVFTSNLVTFDNETFKPIDKFDNFRIVSNINYALSINALKYNTSLLVQGYDTSVTVASEILAFTHSYVINNNNCIKTAMSFDEGITWYTYTNNEFLLLEECVIPKASYELMTTDEKIQFDTAKLQILQNGVDLSNVAALNFNTINVQKIRFAYVLNRALYNDSVLIDNLSWKYNEQGNYKKLTDSECDIETFDRTMKITSNIDNSNLKVFVSL